MSWKHEQSVLFVLAVNRITKIVVFMYLYDKAQKYFHSRLIHRKQRLKFTIDYCGARQGATYEIISRTQTLSQKLIDYYYFSFHLHHPLKQTTNSTTIYMFHFYDVFFHGRNWFISLHTINKSISTGPNLLACSNRRDEYTTIVFLRFHVCNRTYISDNAINYSQI